MGYVGVLRHGQGTEIIFDALQKNPKLRLEIIGEGPLFKTLKGEVKKRNLSGRVVFWGLIQDEKKVIDIIKRWEVALAPYDPHNSNMTYYTEPSKIKFYLEYGIPIVMTKVTHMAPQIDKYNAGISINYTADDLLHAIEKIQKNHTAYATGVQKLAHKYNYIPLYNKAFKFLTTIFT